MHTFGTWLASKTGRPACSLVAEARVTEEWQRSTGRLHYAKVSLAACPAGSFEFASAPNAWASEEDKHEYEPYVLDGIVSELLGTAAPAVVGLRVVLESAVVRDHESNGNAFYQAARLATARLLEGSTGQYRGNCSYPDA
jgi:hypothetical protein